LGHDLGHPRGERVEEERNARQVLRADFELLVPVKCRIHGIPAAELGQQGDPGGQCHADACWLELGRRRRSGRET
jgi:hypothetical protein